MKSTPFRASISFIFVLICFYLSPTAEADFAKPDAYTKIGLGGLNPSNKTEIIAYVPGLTLLYDLEGATVNVRKGNDPTVRRPYRAATTQDGIRLLLLDDKSTIERAAEKLSKYEFLVNRPLPVCLQANGCVAQDLWNRLAAGKTTGSKWRTVWARQGGKFIGAAPSSNGQFMEVDMEDNIDGWVRRYIPTKKAHRSIEDLGYITRLDRPHPLYRFEETSGDGLTTQCTETIKKLELDRLVAEVRAFAKLGAEVAVDPKIPVPFGDKLLKFLGVDAAVKAEASVSGEATFKAVRQSVTEFNYGQAGQSWETKSVRIERVKDPTSIASTAYGHYGNILIKKVYQCAGDVRTKMSNVNITIFLGDARTPVDFDDPLPPLNINPQVVQTRIGLSANPEYAALISLNGQEDYDKIMSYLLIEKGLPRSIAAFIIKEINLSPPLD